LNLFTVYHDLLKEETEKCVFVDFAH